jgi:7-keto-8-aminopelargonate synthetase-like enzyme
VSFDAILNHNPIVNGARGSGATVRGFKHNSKSLTIALQVN